jgi:hypothetical protein
VVVVDYGLVEQRSSDLDLTAMDARKRTAGGAPASFVDLELGARSHARTALGEGDDTPN